MLNRRAFLIAAAAVGVARTVRALEVEDDVISALLRKRVEVEKRSVGMAVCVVTPDHKRLAAWGRERLSDVRPVTSGTVFEIGSITKVFTALLLGEMAQRGEVDLDDPVERHLPSDFHVPELDGRRITLADLATHTSGLRRLPPLSGMPLSPSWLDAVMRFSAEDFKAWLADLRLERAPGAAWEYSKRRRLHAAGHGAGLSRRSALRDAAAAALDRARRPTGHHVPPWCGDGVSCGGRPRRGTKASAAARVRHLRPRRWPSLDASGYGALCSRDPARLGLPYCTRRAASAHRPPARTADWRNAGSGLGGARCSRWCVHEQGWCDRWPSRVDGVRSGQGHSDRGLF